MSGALRADQPQFLEALGTSSEDSFAMVYTLDIFREALPELFLHDAHLEIVARHVRGAIFSCVTKDEFSRDGDKFCLVVTSPVDEEDEKPLVFIDVSRWKEASLNDAIDNIVSPLACCKFGQQVVNDALLASVDLIGARITNF